MRRILLALILSLLSPAALAWEIPVQAVTVVGSAPHDPQASTQGLLFHKGLLYESTGGYGTSSVRVVDPETGAILRRRDLPPDFFGEGLAVHGGMLYQGTWRAGRILLYDLDTLAPLGSRPIEGEVWGLASDGRRLIVSDGSAALYLIDPESWAETGRIEVHDGQGPVKGLNELEIVKGRIWANIYPTAETVVIDPATGRIERRLDLLYLAREMAPQAGGGVPNGIAFEAETGRLVVTGKRWPRLYFIEQP